MKLYVVTLSTEVLVVAKDRREAEEYALKYEVVRDQDFDAEAQDMAYLPGGWDLDAIPYGREEPEDPERTIQGWIQAGAAPAYIVEESLKVRKP